MSQDLKRLVKENSDELAKLGSELEKIQFSYKIKDKPSKEYWQKRIDEFKKYNEIGMEYYNKVHFLMNLVNKEEAQMFLLRMSKFSQIVKELMKTMEQIEKNPSIGDSKDKQQSQWSKKIRGDITEQSDTCLQHEKEMNLSFREFYDKNLKKFLD